jgi:HEAT repeat protein
MLVAARGRMLVMLEWDRILENLGSTDDIDFEEACAALDQAADESRLPDLYRLLTVKENFCAREAAVVPVVRLAGLRALPELLDALRLGEQEGHDNDGPATLICDLVQENPAEAAPLLLTMLRAEDPARRAHAAWLLGFAVPPVTVEPLVTALSADPSEKVRAAAAGALSSFHGSEVAMNGLACALDDAAENVRISAASSLGYLGHLSAVPRLRLALEDRAVRVRAAVEYALEQLGQPR